MGGGDHRLLWGGGGGALLSLIEESVISIYLGDFTNRNNVVESIILI
jgi:hypothetical protein